MQDRYTFKGFGCYENRNAGRTVQAHFTSSDGELQFAIGSVPVAPRCQLPVGEEFDLELGEEVHTPGNRSMLFRPVLRIADNTICSQCFAAKLQICQIGAQENSE